MNNYTKQERLFMLYPDQCMHYFLNQLFTLEKEITLQELIDETKGRVQ